MRGKLPISAVLIRGESDADLWAWAFLERYGILAKVTASQNDLVSVELNA
jgi:hypothetical protein